MTAQFHPRPGSSDIILGWSALGAAALAVFAWSACCVLPLALSIAGLSLAGTAVIAGQRAWGPFVEPWALALLRSAPG